MTSRQPFAPIEELAVSAYVVPTDHPESDGTFAWRETTLVLVELRSGKTTGLGYTYANTATAQLIDHDLRSVVIGANSLAIEGTWASMCRAIRNVGRQGVSSMAISAVDTALWDLKARLLDVPLISLLGPARTAIPIYGSGGFTSYSPELLAEQLGGWVAQGICRVKMKIGTKPEDDLSRVKLAREAIGPDAALFVDANGAYATKQALDFAEQFSKYGVRWFEEPVSSDDLAGLRFLRERLPAMIEVAAGEYGYDLRYFRHMLEERAVDVLQADVTRCGGITGFLQAANLCEAFGVDLSAHCAPALHVAVCCAAPRMRHLEYFHDHVRIEGLLFDGVRKPAGGALTPNDSEPGSGLLFKAADAKRYRVYGGSHGPK